MCHIAARQIDAGMVFMRLAAIRAKNLFKNVTNHRQLHADRAGEPQFTCEYCSFCRFGVKTS